jgi:3-isopropylmalate/(R)-2-methylmalate dehydratase large subunit
VPDPSDITDPLERDSLAKALATWICRRETAAGASGERGVHRKLHQFAHLRSAHAASVLKGRKVHPGVRVMVVPGSQQVKEQAQAEGLDQIFRDAGADWREAGCSMCIAMNGDQLQPGEYSVSTSNRNFEGRQGKGARTFLASPMTAAASAISGVVSDVRELL